MTTLADLAGRLPSAEILSGDDLLEAFLTYAADASLTLYPAQEEALLALFAEKNVILNTPTGSGKSLVASAMHFMALARGWRSFYTAPIKALVSEKFFALCRELGPENVGMMTGDASVNRDAPIICCTAEILANIALRHGTEAAVDCVVMDEFHYYADRDRGVAWQVPLLTLPQAKFLLMSATLGNTKFFEDVLTDLTGVETVLVRSGERPVPLDFEYRETPLLETIQDLFDGGKAPVYIVHFTQRAAIEQAQGLMSIDFLSKEQKQTVKQSLHDFHFDTPFGRDLRRFVHHGVGVHHAGMLPKYRLLVEKLAQEGALKLICGTDTLGVGVNIPIRTVLFTQLCKYDGEKTKVLTVRDFKQIAGRAGRKGFDDRGSVVAQAPEHVIENRILEGKAGGDAKKLRKMVRKKPPERGYAHWDRAVFDRLVEADPEPLVSRFGVSHAMLLQVLSRPGNGCTAMKALIRASHDGPSVQRKHKRTAISMFRSLVSAGVVELVESAERTGSPVRVNAALQEDFSLNQTLSLYVLDAVGALDRTHPEYALDVLSIVESVLEDPSIVLAQQLERIKSQKLAEMKEAGIEYQERMTELDKLEHPKPLKDFIYETFNVFAKNHPWIGAENVRPKSVAREMFEMSATFVEYVKEYGLERSEGLLLRYLSDAYKALVQNVPEMEKTDEVYDVAEWLGTVVRQIDSSLIDEWERMRNSDGAVEEPLEAAPDQAYIADITEDERAFTVLVRNAVWQVVQRLARRELVRAAGLLEKGADETEPWTAERLEAALAPFLEEHAQIRLDPVARSARNTSITQTPTVWRVQQVLVDPSEHNDWFLDFTVDLAKSRVEQRPVLELRGIQS